MRRIIGALIFTMVASGAYSQPPPENLFFDADGVKIRYIEIGTGTPVIALHGFTRDSDSWLAKISDLADDHRLILFDLRGHGLSDKPHSTSEYGRELGHDVIRLMDHLKLSQAHILGYSIGVAPLFMAITEHEERFISAVIGGGTARWEWGNEHDLLNQLSYQRMIRSPRQRRLESGWEGQDQIALANFRLAEKELVVSRESLAMLRIPILAILGSADPAMESVAALQKIISAMEVKVIPGESHNSTPDHPEFIQSVREFLAARETN